MRNELVLLHYLKKYGLLICRLDNDKERSTPETGYSECKCMQSPREYGKSGEDQKRACFEEKLREVALAWHEEKQVRSIQENSLHASIRSTLF
jgi:hypothetical protein